MIKKEGDDFGHGGAGVVKLTGLISNAELKRAESSLLAGECLLAEPCLKELQFRFGEVKAPNSRAPRRYVVTAPGEWARACYLKMRLVPEIPGHTDERKLKQISVAEARDEAADGPLQG